MSCSSNSAALTFVAAADDDVGQPVGDGDRTALVSSTPTSPVRYQPSLSTTAGGHRRIGVPEEELGPTRVDLAGLAGPNFVAIGIDQTNLHAGHRDAVRVACAARAGPRVGFRWSKGARSNRTTWSP